MQSPWGLVVSLAGMPAGAFRLHFGQRASVFQFVETAVELGVGALCPLNSVPGAQKRRGGTPGGQNSSNGINRDLFPPG